jgi:hypothetical protein
MADAKKSTSGKAGGEAKGAAKRPSSVQQRVVLGAAKPGKISVVKLRKAIREVVQRRVAGSSSC